MNVNVDIEQITLDGLDVSQGHADLIRSAISTELQAQLQRTPPDSLRSHVGHAADPASIPVNAGGDMHAFGASLGRSIYQRVVGQNRT